MNNCHPAPRVPTDEDLTPESVFWAHLGDIPESVPHQRPNPGFFFLILNNDRYKNRG